MIKAYFTVYFFIFYPDDQLPHPTLSSTPATVYSTPTMLCDENTVTLTVCPTPSNSNNKSVGVSSTQLQLSANTPSPLPTQMVEITNPSESYHVIEILTSFHLLHFY